MALLIPLISFILLFLIFHQAGDKDFRLCFLKTAIVFAIFTLLVTEILSLFKAFNAFWITLFWGTFFLILFALFCYLVIRKRIIFKTIKFSHPAIKDWLLLIPTLLVVIINTWVAYQTPPNNWDSMVYHLGRMHHWLANQSVDFYATHIQRQLFLSPWMEYGLTHVFVLSGSDRFLNLFGVFFWIGTALLTSYLASLIGADKRAQYYAGITCLLIPTAILQATTTKNDLALCFWVLSAAIFLLKFFDVPSFTHAIFLGLSMGLAILTKNTAYVLLTPLVIWFIAWLIKKRKLAGLKFGILIAVIVIAINANHLIRNMQLFGYPMGPTEETVLYSNAIIGLRPLASNVVRNLAIHLQSTPTLNAVVIQAIEAFHRLLGLGVSDQRTTWPGYEFSLVPFKINEDLTGAPLHLFLIMVCLVILAVKKPKLPGNKLKYILWSVLISFLLFSGYLRWQVWQARLMLSFFMVLSVLLGFVISSYFQRWLRALVMSLMILLAALCLWRNPTKPLPLLYDYNITNMYRILVMIYDNKLNAIYIPALETLDQDLGCREIGLVVGNEFWEYPFWEDLQDNIGADLRIEHINVVNASAVLEDVAFEPCAVIVTLPGFEDQLTLKNGKKYEPTLELDGLTLFIPAE